MVHLRIVGASGAAPRPRTGSSAGMPPTLNIVRLPGALGAARAGISSSATSPARTRASCVEELRRDSACELEGSIAIEPVTVARLRRSSARRAGRRRLAGRRRRLGGGGVADVGERGALVQLRGVHGARDVDRGRGHHRGLAHSHHRGDGRRARVRAAGGVVRRARAAARRACRALAQGAGRRLPGRDPRELPADDGPAGGRLGAGRAERESTIPATLFISHPDEYSALVAVLAGVAGTLSLSTAKSGALVGVLISVTTIPAAANVGVCRRVRRRLGGGRSGRPARREPRLHRHRRCRDACDPARLLRGRRRRSSTARPRVNGARHQLRVCSKAVPISDAALSRSRLRDAYRRCMGRPHRELLSWRRLLTSRARGTGAESRSFATTSTAAASCAGCVTVETSRSSWIRRALCLMGTHYHLLVETPEPNLSAGMHQLNGLYAQAVQHAGTAASARCSRAASTPRSSRRTSTWTTAVALHRRQPGPSRALRTPGRLAVELVLPG